jgi:hypothetical protein
MEAESSSETLVNLYLIKSFHIPEIYLIRVHIIVLIHPSEYWNTGTVTRTFLFCNLVFCVLTACIIKMGVKKNLVFLLQSFLPKLKIFNLN